MTVKSLLFFSYYLLSVFLKVYLFLITKIFRKAIIQIGINYEVTIQTK